MASVSKLAGPPSKAARRDPTPASSMGQKSGGGSLPQSKHQGWVTLELRANGLGVFFSFYTKNLAKLVPKPLWETQVQKTGSIR